MGYVQMTLAVPPTLRKVRRPGGIYVWEGPRPAEHDCDDFWRKLGQSLARNHFDFRPVTGVLCHCGCLLRDETETCPACLLWADDNAVRSSWRVTEFYRSNEHEREAA
jgi:hypothetical protein